MAFGVLLAALDATHAAAAALLAPAARPRAAALAAELGVARGGSAAAEAAQWDAFQSDLLLLAAPRAAAVRKRATAARMARAYPALQPR